MTVIGRILDRWAVKRVCGTFGHSWSTWAYAAGCGFPRPVCKRCGELMPE
jgi:hypothetical protein